eukprot:365253-Chlamydomonas_euryale.AAC.27
MAHALAYKHSLCDDGIVIACQCGSNTACRDICAATRKFGASLNMEGSAVQLMAADERAHASASAKTFSHCRCDRHAFNQLTPDCLENATVPCDARMTVPGAESPHVG